LLGFLQGNVKSNKKLRLYFIETMQEHPKILKKPLDPQSHETDHKGQTAKNGHDKIQKRVNVPINLRNHGKFQNIKIMD
jgi:hypothetical protein